MFQHSTQDDLYRSNDAADERLIKIERSWHKRAQIKLDSQRPDIQLDLQAPDFLEALLPFAHDPQYQNYPHALKLLILSAGWVIYNQKTIAIETEIICPSCIDLLQLGSRLSSASAATISETLADEAYHTLFSINMCELAITQRGMRIKWPELELTRHLSQAQATMSEADFKIYRLAFSLVSETFISDYLADLSDAPDIQPVFRHVVALHKKDELVHKHIFPLFVQQVVGDFTAQQTTLFTRGIANSIRIFPMREIFCVANHPAPTARSVRRSLAAATDSIYRDRRSGLLGDARHPQLHWHTSRSRTARTTSDDRAGHHRLNPACR